MSLQTVPSTVNDDVYASSDFAQVMPKCKIPEHEHSAAHAYQAVHDELMLDGNARQTAAASRAPTGAAGSRSPTRTTAHTTTSAG